jgi:hypothetical protein
MNVEMVQALAARGAVPGEFRRLLRKSISAHGLYLAILALYYAGYLFIRRHYTGFAASDFLLMSVGFVAFSVPIMILGLGFMRIYYVAAILRAERPIPALIADLKAYVTDSGRLAHGLPMVFIMMLFMNVFVDLKANIPILHAYNWDTTFAGLDRAIHFGIDPWRLLQPVFGYPYVTFLINLNYDMWFAIMWMVWVFFGFAQKTSVLRTRFFLTFFLTWIVAGSVLAVWLASVGPCFYGRFGLTPDPYAPLLAYLRHANEVVPIFSIPVQDMLWQGLNGKSLIDGISAMPSLHNGTALLFALAGFKVNRGVGWALMAHAILIYLGSVHLAWHYAVDTYVAWAVVLVLWFAMEPVARWWHALQEQTDFSSALEARV